MAGFIREDVLQYLEENFTSDNIDELIGADLARELDIPGRSARRYAEYYRTRFNKTAVPLLRSTKEVMSTVIYDLETTDFGTEGYYGQLICACFYPLNGSGPYTLKRKFNDINDKNLLREVAQELSKYNYRVGHNIASFDDNWMNSRLMFYNLPPLDSAHYFDTYQIAKSLAVKTPKSLGNLADYFGLGGIKTTIRRTSWSNVYSKNEDEFDEAMDNIVYHCEQDTILNHQLFPILHYYALQNGRITNPWKKSKMMGNYWREHDT